MGIRVEETKEEEQGRLELRWRGNSVYEECRW